MQGVDSMDSFFWNSFTFHIRLNRGGFMTIESPTYRNKWGNRSKGWATVFNVDVPIKYLSSWRGSPRPPPPIR